MSDVTANAAAARSTPSVSLLGHLRAELASQLPFSAMKRVT